MSFFLDEDTATSAVNETNFTKGNVTGFKENFQAAYNYALKTELSSSQRVNLMNKYGEIIDTAASLGHTNLTNPFIEDPYESEAGAGLLDGETIESEDQRINYFHDQLDNLQRTDPNLAKALEDKGINSVDSIQKQIGIDAQEAFRNFQDIKSRSNTKGTIGSYGGIGAAVFQDPYIVSTLPLGMMYSLPKSFLAAAGKIAAIEAVLAGVAEVGIQYQVQPYRKELGFEEAGFEEGAKRILTATAAGAIGGPLLFGLFKGIGKGIDLGKDGLNILKGKLEELPIQQVKAIYNELVKKNPKLKNEAVESLDNKFLEPDTPFQESLTANKEHVVRSNEMADYVIANKKLDKVLENPESPIDVKLLDEVKGRVQRYDPDEIEFDAKTFQYKTGGDARGVTKKLQGVEIWDEPSANAVLVYEFADGRKAIVDGHQRLGLAKRLKAKGQKIKLLAYNFKEVDGITPDMIMIKGMMQNLRNNTGSATDAARILRSKYNLDWEKIKKSLPPQMKLVKNALGLSKLSDDAWGLFLNKGINEDLASKLGQTISNKEVHNKLLASLANRKFNSLQEMDSVLFQIQNTPTQKIKQETLFGTEFFEESLILEKANLISYVARNKKRLKGAFKTLVDNEGDLAAAGNVLDKQTNIEKGIENAKVFEKINTVATRVGQLSDDFNAAAKLLKEGKTAEARELANTAVERAIERGDFDGVSTSGPIRDDASETTTQAISSEQKLESQVDLKELEEFSDLSVNTKGLEKQSNDLENNLFGEELPKGEARVALSLEEETLVNEIKAADATLENVNKYQNHPLIKKRFEEAKKLENDTSTKAGYSADKNAPYWKTRDYKDYGTGSEEFINKFYGEGASIKNKELTIVLGPTASGKSTIINKIKSQSGSILADSDEIKKVLPEFAKGYNSNGVHKESSFLNRLLMEKASENGDNIIYPTTGREMDKLLTTISLAEARNYKVKVYYVTAKREELLLRNTARVITSNRVISNELLDDAVVKQIERNYNSLNEKYKIKKIDTSRGADSTDILGSQPRRNETDEPAAYGFEEEVIAKYQDDDLIQGTQVIDETTGEITVVDRTVKSIKDDHAQDVKFIERLKDCV